MENPTPGGLVIDKQSKTRILAEKKKCPPQTDCNFYDTSQAEQSPIEFLFTFAMGQGRRIGKKQGPPTPLSEEHFAKLKRKAGLPVDDPPAKAPYSKRRRTSKNPEPPTSNGKAKGAAPTKEANGSKASLKGAGKKAGKAKAKSPSPELDSDEAMGDEFDASDLDDQDDEFPGLDGAKLGDDFIDSDDESVFDSDQEDATGKKQQFVFSDDEDDGDSDREERLTAANIVGLSRKLDKKLEEDKEAADAEMRESALQTNIDGEDLLDEEGDDDELATKGKSLLAPDLQMLRQRITDTIRVLDDFSKLGAGRSRAEYTEQLLSDICAVRTSPVSKSVSQATQRPRLSHLRLPSHMRYSTPFVQSVS